MVKKIWRIISKYMLLKLLLFGSLLAFASTTYVRHALENNLFPKGFEKLISYAIFIATIVLYCVIFFFCIISIYYADHTGGRIYISDTRKYNRSYFDLLSYFKDANPYRMDDESLPCENWKEAEGVILGKYEDRLVKRPSSAPGNLCVFGLPGSHKTTSQIIPTALRFGGSCLVIDIKGDVLSWTKSERKIKIFNPENAASSCHFNPLDGINKMSLEDRIQHIESMSYILLEEDPKDKYFIPGGRDYWCGIALYLLAQDINTTFDSICHQISLGDPFTWTKRIVASDCDEAKSYVASYVGTNEKNVAGCYNTIAKAVRPFITGSLAEVLKASSNSISPADLENGIDIYIEIPQDKIKLYAPITTIIVQNFLTAFMRRSDSSTGIKSRPIIFLLDEFPQLNFDFATLSMALSTLRSKGVTLFLAQQSIAQIENRYGETQCREIIDTCAYLSIMSAQDPKSRDFFQKLIGTEKVLKRSNSVNSKDSSVTVTEAREPIFQPEDFGNLGENVIIYANGKYIKAEKTNCFE